ncbi:hypothetical protein FGG08_000412 [Glutinoglossum americanum]|uniref:HORMA domain-containing protein n=1 Tax=Glutinoglossum americanum TaxID=1670608 RepID=A0A9P8I413_9PEZI|nr:hypothetical protein FGG08_000412 [Glutinoglossum americanum]
MPTHTTLDTYQGLVSTFADFLVVAIHTVLYERDIYPRASFLSARKYNFPVRQNRHPKVCRWVADAVSAVETELLKGTVARVAVVIYSSASQPLERFVFDLSSFPAVPPAEATTPFLENSATVSLVDLAEQFRGVMQKLAFCGSSLTPLPENCSFTVCIELKANEEAPIGQTSTPWIPSQPSLQPVSVVAGGAEGESSGLGGSGGNSSIGKDLGGVKTTPVRAVESGSFVLEVWVEEGRAKMNGPPVVTSG